ncbi:thiol-disulfide oxidoreductase DCC family protein [Rhodocaloribacter sp.]
MSETRTDIHPEAGLSELPEHHAFVLFDGVCNLCNGSVNFIIDRDPNGYFRFASLQSEEAEAILRRAGISGASLESIVLVEGERVYRRSDAVLRIARKLKGGWPALALFSFVPRPIRDWVYDWIARNRYRWFGKRDTCRIPTPELRSRFL